jgi:hypothetical protein
MKDSPFNFFPRKYFLCQTVLSCLCFPPETVIYRKHFYHISVFLKKQLSIVISTIRKCLKTALYHSVIHISLTVVYNTCVSLNSFLRTFVSLFHCLLYIQTSRCKNLFIHLPFRPQEQRIFLQCIWFLFLSAQIFAIHLFLFLCHTAFWHAAVSLFTSSSYQLCNHISMLAMQHFVIHLL